MKDDLQIMIDLETLALTPDAVVTQLGYALFRLGGTTVEKSGCYHLNVGSQINLRRKIDWETIKWWLLQEDGPRKLMANVERRPVVECLQDFNCGLPWSEIKGTWGHGLNFDIPIVCSLNASFGFKEPWHYRTPRDTRTMMALSRGVVDKVRATDVKHSAEHDAIAQALTMQDCYRAIFVGTPGKMP